MVQLPPHSSIVPVREFLDAIGKRIERFDRGGLPEGRVVFALGSRHGAWVDGDPLARTPDLLDTAADEPEGGRR